MAFEISPATSDTLTLAITEAPAHNAAAAQHMGRFVQIRVNGVDLGDDKVEVIDFICAGQTAQG